MPEPQESGGELVQVNGGEISWWNDTYEASIYIPSTNEILSAAGNFALGNALGLSKDIMINIAPKSNGRMSWKYRKHIRRLGWAGAAFSPITLGLDIANIWTEDGYTKGERVVETGILIAETGVNAAVGVIAGQAVKAVGYFIGGSTAGVVVIMLVVGGIALAACGYGVYKVSESLYRQYLDWRTSGNLYKDTSVKVM